ncbi:hypothetical protein [Lysinibacillus parviboronicapiens]|uniref:hypothetical protein n=1 Tax=Lysinibacillus parviboronicapiens TaxID=436516 RepID=UPI000D3B4028|nr:hypothetical protein [Lysinibacillus parviboronicapiens]
MSELDDKEQDVVMEHIIHQFLKEQRNKSPDNGKVNDNSFAFLEKTTLNLLLAYLLSGESRGKSEIADEEFELLILKQLDDIMDTNQKQFEEIIDLLREIT